MSEDGARLELLDQLPRERLAVEPTPLVRALALERELAATLGRAIPRILIKLDSYTGFAMGGNKVRKLEYVLAPERLEGVTHLVTAGGVDSNHARVTAAAAARLGLGCVLILNGEPPVAPRGNALLQRLFGAEIRMVRTRAERTPLMEIVADDIAAAGGRALVIPVGASTPLGALGYVRAGKELHGQLAELDPPVDAATVVIAASSCGTLAGLYLAISMLGAGHVRLFGVSADVSRAEILQDTVTLASGAGLRLGWSGELAREQLDATDAFVGDGYGIPTTESERAREMFGRYAGVLLDPTYTAKAAAAFLHAIRTAQIPPGHTAVFWHTGGWPSALG